MNAMETLGAVFTWVLRTSGEAAVIVLVILAAHTLLRKRLKPRWRYALWLILVARLVMPWAPESSLSIFSLLHKARETTPIPYGIIFQEEPTAAPVVNAAASSPAMAATHPSFWTPLHILSLLWLLGATAFTAHVAFENTCFWLRVRNTQRTSDPSILDLFRNCRELIFSSPTRSTGRTVRIITTNVVTTPALFGFLRPRLLLPVAMAEAGDLEALRYVFLHELAHLKRHDVLMNWLTTLVQAVHWFNPLLWYAFHRMRIDREPACDALALSCLQPEESEQYGHTILDLLESVYTVRRVPGMAGILEDKSQLKGRITQIALFTRDSYRWSLLACLVLAVVATLGLTNAASSSSEDLSEPPARATISAAEQHLDVALQPAPFPAGSANENPRTEPIGVMTEGPGATKPEPPAPVTVSVAQEQIEAGPQVETHVTTEPGTVGTDKEAPVETRYYELRDLDKNDYAAIERYIAEELPESPKQRFVFHDDHNQCVLTDTTDNLAQFERWLAEVDVTANRYMAELRVMTMKKEEAESILGAYCNVNSSKPISFTIPRQDVEKLTGDLDRLPSTELLSAPHVTFKVRPALLKTFVPKLVLRNTPPRAAPVAGMGQIDHESFRQAVDLFQHPQAYSASFASWLQKSWPVEAVICDCNTEFFASASGTPVPRMSGILAGYKVMPIANSEDCSVNFYFNSTRLVKKGRGLAFWKPRPLPEIHEVPLEGQLSYTHAKPVATVFVRDTEEADCVEMLLFALTKAEGPGYRFAETH